MSLSRRLLVLVIAVLLAGPVSPWGQAPAAAESVGVVVDGFDSAGAGPLGPRTATGAGGATFSVSGSAGHISLPGANGVSMSVAYTFNTLQNLGANGATVLQFDFDSVTSPNPGGQAGNLAVTATDNTGQSDQAFFGVSAGQTVGVISLTGTESYELHGPGDQTKIASMTFQFFPGSNVNGPHNFNIGRIATVNPSGSGGNQPQAISFTTTPPNPASIGSTYSVSATGGGSGNPVTFSVGSGTTNAACTVAGSTVTFVHAGTCQIAADQAGGPGYDPAPKVTQSTSVAKSGQSISFTSTAPTPGSVGATYTVTATGGGSGNPVTFSVGAGTTNAACTVAGSTVTFAHAGTCVVAADQAGNADYNAAAQKTQSIGVGPGAQAITFTSTPPSPAAIGGTYTVVATGGGSGNPVTFSVGAGTTNAACTVAGSTVTFAHAGTCVVAADQAGNADYNAAAQKTQSIAVAKTAQTITFTSTPPSPAAIGGTYTVVATGGGSGNPVTFSVGAGTTNAACTVAGSTVTFAHAGTCVVAADQAGDADFAAAAQKTQSITVAKTAQTITITSTPPSPAAIGGTYPVTTTGGASGNPVVLSIDPATTNSACTLSGTTVTFAHAGTCVVAADQAGNADFDPAPQKTQTIAVAKTAQAITFTTAPPSPAFVGTTYVVGATGGGSGNPVTFSTSSPSCSLAGTTVTFLAAGPCDIDADQAGGPDFDAAPTATQIVAVTKVTSTVAVDIAPGATVHGQPATATATVTPALGSASGSVQFSVDGTDLGAPVAVSGGTAATALPADLGAGSHTIGAAFAPTDSTTFATATGSDTLAVGKAATAVLPSVSPHSIKATVTATPPGAGTPTGTVRFLVDGNPVGTGTLDAAGSATLAFTVPAGKTASVAAAYDGDADFLPSSASTARKDPTISASVSGKPKKTKAGWYRGTVTVSFSCAPNGAPLTSPCPSPVVLKRGGAGQSVSQTVTAADGGIGTASVGGINIDHRKPKVQIIGVKASGRYPSAPKARCKGTDKLSGIASCRIRQHKLSGNRVRYTAVATDKAGNRARRSVTVALAVSHVSILGLAAHGGAYDVTLGGSYTLVVIGGPRPRYVDAAVAPQQPSGLDAYFHQDGTVRGQPRWVLGVTITTDMGHSTLWNLGVLQGGRLHVVKVRVH